MGKMRISSCNLILKINMILKHIQSLVANKASISNIQINYAIDVVKISIILMFLTVLKISLITTFKIEINIITKLQFVKSIIKNNVII